MLRIFVALMVLSACEQSEKTKKEDADIAQDEIQITQRVNYEISTLHLLKGWGYQIRKNGKLILDQPTIPGRPGLNGFQSQEDAQKVAELVVSKLKAQVFPPTVNEDDLKNLNIH